MEVELGTDPNKNDWMLVRDGRNIIILVFVEDGVVTTAFAPTFEEVDGPAGHVREYVEWYIKTQGMEKRLENVPIVGDVDEGEQATDPGPRPEPPDQE